ncbi:hypothetical protein HHI36_000970 [Cryptolaemus montrouzieri]|uniref:Uncharacterized protein n=1 Tax=Cryptolaemus montrouzieri TaxID=559131 RepID=A0ABD2P6J6_9CUCU
MMFKVSLCLALLVALTLGSPAEFRVKRQSLNGGLGANGFRAGANPYNQFNPNPYNPYNPNGYNPYYQNEYYQQGQAGFPGQTGFQG